MSLPALVKWLGCAGLSAILWSACASAGQAQTFGTPIGASSCNTCAPTHHCPPAYKHTYEGAPHIHFHRGCPHPICNPCDLPHFGYWETCWSPFPFGPSWGHCLTPPPAAFVILNPLSNQHLPGGRTPSNLPSSGGLNPPVSPMPMPTEEIPLPRPKNGPR